MEHSDFMRPNFPHLKQVKLEEVKSFFLNFFLCWKDLPLGFLFFINFLNFLTINVRFSLSEPYALSSSLSSLDGMEDFSAQPLLFFYLASSSTILVTSISYSLNFPSNLTCVRKERFFDLEIVMTFGCHVLLRDFSIFTFNSSFSNTILRPLR